MAQYPEGRGKRCSDCWRFFCSNKPLPAEAIWILADKPGVPPQKLVDAEANATCEQQGGYGQETSEGAG